VNAVQRSDPSLIAGRSGLSGGSGGALYGVGMNDDSSVTCPICGKGTLRTTEFGSQRPESREVLTFTCGHQVQGAKLETADADRLDVERRTSEETVTPVESDTLTEG
jgi:hypothetical protein